MVVYLIEHGADMNSTNHKNQTPLHYSSENGHPKVSQYIVYHGANIDPQDNDIYS